MISSDNNIQDLNVSTNKTSPDSMNRYYYLRTRKKEREAQCVIASRRPDKLKRIIAKLRGLRSS